MSNNVTAGTLINQQDLLDILKDLPAEKKDKLDTAEIFRIVKAMPACDKNVEVIRCKDCKYMQSYLSFSYSSDPREGRLRNRCVLRDELLKRTDGYCSYAERRPEGESSWK